MEENIFKKTRETSAEKRKDERKRVSTSPLIQVLNLRFFWKKIACGMPPFFFLF
jgi:hypothetical protein